MSEPDGTTEPVKRMVAAMDEAGELPARGLRRYVRLVAEAVGAGPSAWCCEVDALSTAYIAAEGRLTRFPDRDIALVWDEENGWAAGIELGAGKEVAILGYLGEDVVPPPKAVARYVGELLSSGRAGEGEPPRFRQAGARDGLHERLASYAFRPQTHLRVRQQGSTAAWSDIHLPQHLSDSVRAAGAVLARRGTDRSPGTVSS